MLAHLRIELLQLSLLIRLLHLLNWLLRRGLMLLLLLLLKLELLSKASLNRLATSDLLLHSLGYLVDELV